LLQRRRDRLHTALFAPLEKQSGDLLHEQGHATSALAHPFHHILRERMPRRKFGDHPRDLRAVERAKRHDAVMRVRAPRRAKFRPRGRDNEQRGLRATLAQGSQHIDRRWVGPLQVLEGEQHGLRARARHDPGD
jgi:hypothetical protein